MFFWNSCFFNDPADVGNLITNLNYNYYKYLQTLKILFLNEKKKQKEPIKNGQTDLIKISRNKK